MDDKATRRDVSALSEMLGPLPEGDVTALSDYFDADGSRQSLAYSGDQVRALMAKERERRDKIEAALWTAIHTLERDGDEWNVCDHLRAAFRA